MKNMENQKYTTTKNEMLGKQWLLNSYFTQHLFGGSFLQ